MFACGAARTQEQDCSTHSLTMVAPWAAAGGTDIMGRVMAHRMSEVLGQTAVAENPPGGGGMAGASHVAHADADDYIHSGKPVGSHRHDANIAAMETPKSRTSSPRTVLMLWHRRAFDGVFRKHHRTRDREEWRASQGRKRVGRLIEYPRRRS